METVRYNYKLRPGSKALTFLMSEHHNSVWLWNECVHQQKSGRKPTFVKLNALLTEARKQKWLRKGSSVSQQQTIKTYAKALSDSYKIKSRGKPKAKLKKNHPLPSLNYTTAGFSIQNGKLKLPHKITIPIVWSRPLPSSPSSVRVYQDNLGVWYASFVVKLDSTQLPPIINLDPNSSIGIDWGITATATTSDSAYDLPFQGNRTRCQAEIAKAQRKMARRRTHKKTPNTKGYNKAKLSSAKLQKKAKRQTKHTAIQWSKSLAQTNQTIHIEDLKPKFMFSSNLARKASDASIGIIKSTLIEQATRAGRTVVIVPPAYTTQTCSRCLARAKRHVERSDKIFLCDNPPCTHKEHRDRNASKVVVSFGKSILDLVGIAQASVESVSRGYVVRKIPVTRILS